MTLNLKFDLDPQLTRKLLENECHHQTPRGRFSLKKSMFAAVTNCSLFRHFCLDYSFILRFTSFASCLITECQSMFFAF